MVEAALGHIRGPHDGRAPLNFFFFLAIMYSIGPSFFPPILCVVMTLVVINCPQEELSKFGYRSKRGK